jgi:PAS domain S-box-containing protein
MMHQPPGTILVVEDETIVGRDIQARLTELGYGVAAVLSSGEEALEYLASHKPDLVLMDIRLKGEMDGIAAADKVRDLYNVPVVFLTAFVDEKTLQRARVTEAFGYILKPFETRDLHITIAMALSKHRMETELRESEQRYRDFFQDDLTGDYVATPDGRLLECNPAFLGIFGFPTVEAARRQNLLALYPDARSRDHFFERLRKEGKLTYYEKELVRPDGIRVHLVENAIGRFDAEGELVEYKGYMFDDTRRKRLEDQLHQSQKMESIGTMASGIAHDFNNILNNVLGFALQIRKHAGDPERVLKYSQTIEKSAARGAELSSKLLSFARAGKRENAPVDVGRLVEEIATLCTEAFPRSIAFTSRVHEPIYDMLGDHGGLYQVLINLCVNARDAVVARHGMSGGELIVEARTATVGQDVSPELLGSGNPLCIELRVTDNGTGMTPEIRDRIFDPFFTTKERGQGTGLGLSVVYTIVRNHGGTILVESEVGVGTTFRVFLPAIRKSAAKEKPVEVAPATRGGSEIVLVVDDEETMQELAKELLEEEGYGVVLAANGQEALEIYRRRPGEIDLVILDLMMPGMDGSQTYVELKKIDPSVRAFFCTGYMPDQVADALLKRERLQMIHKPFHPPEFLKVVRDILDLPV